MNSSVLLKAPIMLWNHHHHPALELFSSSPKETLYSLNSNSSLFLSLTPGKHHSTLCLYGFDYSRYFLKMKLHSIIIFVTHYFTSHNVSKVHPCWNMSEFPPFLSLNNIPLHTNSPSYPFIHEWTPGLLSPLGYLWIMLL